MSNVTLHIERLVIEGLPVGSHDGPLVQAAIEAELARLIGEGAFSDHRVRDTAIPFVRGEPLALAGSGGTALGTQIGRAIHAEIGQ